MKKIIFCLLSIGLISSFALAGGEPSYFYLSDSKDACGKDTASGEHILSQTDKCTLVVYSYEKSEFWIEYRPIGSNNYIKFSKVNSLKIKKDYSTYEKTISIPMRTTGQYRVAFDTNFNGYPDFYSSSLWLYESETSS